MDNEQSSAESAPSEATSDNMTIEQQHARAIAGGDKLPSVESQVDESTPSPETTPVDGNQANEPAPGDGQPAEGEGNTSEEGATSKPDSTVDTQREGAAAGDTSEEDKAKAAAEAERARNDLLGLTNVEPETLETITEKYQQSSTEGKRLRADIIAREEALSKAGVDFMLKADGTYGLVPNENYTNELDDTMIPNVFAELSEDQKDLAESSPEEFAKLITKKAMAATQAMRPPATARGDEAVISDDVRNEVYGNFLNSKLADGKTARYPDADDPEIVDLMLKLAKDPSQEPIVEMMQKSPEAHHMGLVSLYSQVWRVEAPRRAMKADAEAQEKLKQEENKRALSTSGDSVSTNPSAVDTSGMSGAEKLAMEIAGARRN